jgi:hypothetical protein
VAVLLALGGPRTRLLSADEPDDPGSDLEVLRSCPQGSLPLSAGAHGCIPLPDQEQLALDAKRSAHARRTGQIRGDAFLSPREADEEIPRLPDRPESFERYQLPVDPVRNVSRPEQPTSREEARHGIRIRSDRGAPVTLVDLDSQSARPEVLLVGELHGVTVIVKHQVERDGTARSYLAVYGQLARPGPGIVSGHRLEPLAVIGYLTDEKDATPELYFEVRRQRAADQEPPPYLTQVVSNAISVATDPRNVLPLRK